MANTIEYAKIFQPELDAAAVEQATSGWMEVTVTWCATAGAMR